jgi:predicted phage terminase large subunit-like protein
LTKSKDTVTEAEFLKVLQTAAPDHFWAFCRWYDNKFFARRPFLKKIALGFQRVYEEYKQGRAIKLSASLPPRAGKSFITSLFCAWWLGKLPEVSVMRNTCTATLYRKFSYDVRNIVKSDKYRAIFPNVQLADDKQNLDGWNLKTSRQVGYFGAGVGGTIIGFGANIALSDDLYKSMEDALSETIQEGVAIWKQSAHNSRMEKNCPEIYIGTRWTKNDEIGKAIEKNQIDIQITIPALIENEAGQMVSFCEDVKSTEEYLKIKADTDEEIWEAEYMQNPVELKGLLFPKSELKFYDPQEVDLSKGEFVFCHFDASDTGGDFYAAPLCVLIENAIYVPEVMCSTLGVEVTEPESIALLRRWKAHAVTFEGVGGWVTMGKSIRAKIEEDLPDCDFRIVKPTTNKITRILAQSGFIKRNFYFRKDYEGHKQYVAFLNNLTSYLRHGGAKHDDAPDALAACGRYFADNFSHLF